MSTLFKSSQLPLPHEIIAARDQATSATPRCDICHAPITDPQPATGLLLWFHDNHPTVEKPLLCEKCAHAIHMASRSVPWDDE